MVRVSSWLSWWVDGLGAVVACWCPLQGTGVWDILPGGCLWEEVLRNTLRSPPKVLIWAEFQDGRQIGTDMPHGENEAPAEFEACVQNRMLDQEI